MWTADSLEKTLMLGKIKGKRRRGNRDEMVDNITNSTDMSLSKFQEIVEDRGAWNATLHEVANSRLNNNQLFSFIIKIHSLFHFYVSWMIQWNF